MLVFSRTSKKVLKIQSKQQKRSRWLSCDLDFSSPSGQTSALDHGCELAKVSYFGRLLPAGLHRLDQIRQVDLCQIGQPKAVDVPVIHPLAQLHEHRVSCQFGCLTPRGYVCVSVGEYGYFKDFCVFLGGFFWSCFWVLWNQDWGVEDPGPASGDTLICNRVLLVQQFCDTKTIDIQTLLL